MARECQARERLAEPAGESPTGVARESQQGLERESQAELTGESPARLERESPARASKGTQGRAGRSAPGQAGMLELSRPCQWTISHQVQVWEIKYSSGNLKDILAVYK